MRIFGSVAVGLLLAGCGATMWPTLTGVTPQSVKDTLACAGKAAESRGYYLRSRRGDTWVEGKKDVPYDKQRQYNEIRRYDVLWMTVADQPEGARLKIEARSYSERETRRGPTIEDQYATAAVQADAQGVLETCGGPQASVSEPPPVSQTPVLQPGDSSGT
jgi:hypothetical protein